MTCVCDLMKRTALLPPPCRRSHSQLTLTLSVHSCAPRRTRSLLGWREAWGVSRPPRHVTARTGSSASPHKTVQSIKSIRETNMSIYSLEVGGKQFHLRCIISVDFVRTLIYSVYSAEKMVLLFRLRIQILSRQIFSFFLPRCFFVDHGLIQHTCK